MIKYFIKRDFRSTCSWFICRNAEGVHAHVSECLKGTTRSMKICRSLLQPKKSSEILTAPKWL